MEGGVGNELKKGWGVHGGKGNSKGVVRADSGDRASRRRVQVKKKKILGDEQRQRV